MAPIYSGLRMAYCKTLRHSAIGVFSENRASIVLLCIYEAIMTGELKRWGNSLALRIPKDFLTALGLDEGSKVELELSGGKLVVVPSRSVRSKRLLEALEKHGKDPHGELEWGEDVGKEQV
jgi:antitoxin MazE